MVKRSIKNKEIFLSERMELNKEEGTGEKIVVYKMRYYSNENQKYVVFSHARGRYELFDYLLIITLDFSVEKADVIKYRSEHGGEIASKKWLTQFENYDSGTLTYGTDISALSGATLSAKSLTNDIPAVLRMLKKTFGD